MLTFVNIFHFWIYKKAVIGLYNCFIIKLIPATPSHKDNIRNLHVQVGAYPQSHVPHSAYKGGGPTIDERRLAPL